MVLVTAAASGMGNVLVVAGRHLGATVVGVAGGADKVARVRDLGADPAVDYTEPGWPELVREALGDREVSVVMDGVGGGALEDGGRTARPQRPDRELRLGLRAARRGWMSPT